MGVGGHIQDGRGCRLKKSRMRRVSPRQRRKQAAWNKITRERIAEVGGVCQIQSPVCTQAATEGHHTQPKGRGGEWTKENCTPCCNACNIYCHHHPTWAEAAGFLLSGHVLGEKTQ